MWTAKFVIGMGVVCGFVQVSAAQLFATGSASGGQNRYYSIDVNTGLATQLSNIATPTLATTTTGLAFTPQGLAYGVTNAGQLCTPDFAANTFANIGPLGFNPPGIPINSGNFDILADGRAFLVQTNEFSPLFQVDLATGATTPIGETEWLTVALFSAGGNVGGGNQPIIVGLGSLGNTLYGIENRTNSLVAIDADTGFVFIPGGLAGQLGRGTLPNGVARSRYSTFAGVSGYDSNGDGVYDKLYATVNTFDGFRYGGLVEINVTDGSWLPIGNGNSPLNFFALGAPIAVVEGCDGIDFNGDGLFPDDQDLVDFLSVLAGGACSTGTCNDIDFNNDELFPDDNDLVAFLTVLAGGDC